MPTLLETICEAEGCARRKNGPRHCLMHKKRLKRTGRLDRDMPVVIPKPGEEWRGFRDTDYEVSSLGRVRRGAWTRIVGRAWPLKKIAGTPNQDGYLMMRPFARPDRRTVAIHRMVAEVFHGDPPEGYEVNHIDRDRTNNAAENLEYVTHHDNVLHAWASGEIDRSGEANGRAKLTESQVRAVRRARAAGISRAELSRRHGITVSQVSRITSRRAWAHVD